VILDRCLESRLFVQDIRGLKLPFVETFQAQDPQESRPCYHLQRLLGIMQLDQFVVAYFQALHLKSKLYLNTQSAFNVARKDRNVFYKQMSLAALLKELAYIEKIAIRIFRITELDQRQLSRFALVRYVYQLLLSTFLALYSSLSCIFLNILGKHSLHSNCIA